MKKENQFPDSQLDEDNQANNLMNDNQNSLVIPPQLYDGQDGSGNNDQDNIFSQNPRQDMGQSTIKQISLQQIGSRLFQKGKIDKKIQAISDLILKIEASKDQIYANQQICDWIIASNLIEIFLTEDSHPEILKKIPSVLKFVYENLLLDDDWIKNYAVRLISCRKYFISAFEEICDFLSIQHILLLFKTLQHKQNIDNFPDIIADLINSPAFNIDTRKKDKSKNDSADIYEKKDNQSLNYTPQRDLLNQLVNQDNENYPETEMDIDQAKQQKIIQFTEQVYHYLIKKIQTNNPKQIQLNNQKQTNSHRYVSVLNKLIQSKHKYLQKHALKTIIDLLKNGKSLYLIVFEYFVKAIINSLQIKEKGTKYPQTVSFIEKVAQNGLYQHSISFLARNRFNKQMTQRILSIFTLIGKYYKPFQKNFIVFLWRILGENSRDQKQREQFFCFIKENLKYESAFTEQCLTYIYQDIALSLDVSWFSLKVYQCFELLFSKVNQDLKLMVYHSFMHQYVIKKPDLIGVQKFWQIYFNTEDDKTLQKCRQFLKKLIKYLKTAQIRIRNQFYAQYWKQIQKALLDIRFRYCLPKYRKIMDIMDKFLKSEEEQFYKKRQKSEFITIQVKNQTTKALPPKDITLKIRDACTLQELQSKILQNIVPKTSLITIHFQGHPLTISKQTLKQKGIYSGSILIVNDRYQQQDMESYLSNDQLKTLQNIVQKLKQIYGSLYQQSILQYVALKYSDYSIETIISIFMDQTEIQKLRCEMQINKKKNQKKNQQEYVTPYFSYHNNNQQEIENIQKIQLQQDSVQQMKLSDYIISKSIHIRLILEQVNRYDLKRGWQTIKLLPHCPVITKQIKQYVQKNMWDQILPRQDKISMIYNLYLLKGYLLKFKQGSLKYTFNNIIEIRKHLEIGFKVMTQILLQQMQKQDSFQSILVKSICQILLLQLHKNTRFKDLRNYEVINHYGQGYKLRKYILQKFLDGDQKKHWGSRQDSQSDQEQEFDNQQKWINAEKCLIPQIPHRILNKMLKFIVSDQLNNNSVGISISQALIQVLFYSITKSYEPFSTIILLEEDQLYRFYAYHGYLAQYIMLYCLSQISYKDPQTQQYVYQTITQKIVNIMINKYQCPQKFNHKVLALYDTLSNIINFYDLNVPTVDIVNKVAYSLGYSFQHLGPGQFASIIQILTVCFDRILKQNQQYKLSGIIQPLINWLINNYIFNIYNINSNMKDSILRKYCYQMLAVLMKPENSYNQIKQVISSNLQNICCDNSKQTIKEEQNNLRNGNFIGLKNLGSTCYLNSLLQQMYHTKFAQMLICQQPNPPPNSVEIKQKQHIHQLKLIFMRLYSSCSKFVDPTKFIHIIDFYGQPINPQRQQDANQFLLCLFHRIEDAGYKQQVLDVFGGNLKAQISFKIKQIINVRQQHQHFNSLTVDIKNRSNLEEALDDFFKPQILSGQNMYHIEELGIKTKAVKKNFLASLPKILILTLKRFQYDFSSRSRIKLDNYLQFSMQLNIHKYLEQNSNKEISIEDCSYRLVGILLHKGSAESGHYYSIIKVGQKWYEFNDQLVMEFDLYKMRQQCFGYSDGRSCSNAYMIFYQKVHTNYHGIHLDKVPMKNPIRKIINEQNEHFIKKSLRQQPQFIKLLKASYQYTKNPVFKTLIANSIKQSTPEKENLADKAASPEIFIQKQQIQDQDHLYSSTKNKPQTELKIIEDKQSKMQEEDQFGLDGNKFEDNGFL